MITFSTYHDFLSSLAAEGLQARPVRDLATGEASGGALLFMKHDVEARLDRALRMAQIEADCGHRATYYFQGDLLRATDAPALVRAIGDLGHEVAYHYDVLDACDGDFARAMAEFDSYRAMIEAASGQPVTTVCPHGNPTKVRSGWHSNKDFFRAAEVRARYPEILDIVVDFPRLLPHGRYVSDAGFKLRTIGDIAGNDQSNETAIADGVDIAWRDVARIVQDGAGLVVSLHPHRMQESALRLGVDRALFGVMRTGYRLTKRVPLVSRMANRLYKLARRF